MPPWLRRHRFEIVLIAPLVLYVALLTLAPIADTLRLSLTASDGTFPSLASYRTIVASTVFRRAVANTIVVSLLSLTLELGLGLGVALALHASFRFRGFVRTVILIPLGVPTIVSGAVMLLVFARSGYLTSVLGVAAEGLGLAGIAWEPAPPSLMVAGGWRTLLTVAIADTWKVLPIVTLILLAGLQAIPEELYEAADVDGATRWHRFVRITLPLLGPYVTMALILRAIDAFRIFELALVLAGRIEPVLGTFIWSRYGPPTNDAFTAAAASMVLFGLVMAFVVLYLRLVAMRRAVSS
jgi:trehalose transport system permease protein